MEINLNRNAMIAVGAGVVGILTAVAAFLLYGEISRFNTAKDDLNSSKSRLKRYYQSNPFPSPENVAKEKENVTALNDWAGRIQMSLRKGEVPLEEKTPAILLKQLGDTQNALQKLAPSRFPPDFRFGFDRYKDWIPPLANEVKQLLEQIVVIETITRLLLEEDVVFVQSITREEFEGKAPGGTVATDVPDAPQSPHQLKHKDISLAVAPSVAKSLYDKSRYVFEFTAKEASLLRIMNRLGKHGIFMAVTSVEVDAIASDVRPAPRQDAQPAVAAAADTAAGNAAVAAPPVVAGEAGKAPYIDRRDRVVSGERFAAPMKVKLVLDTYRFKEAVAQ